MRKALVNFEDDTDCGELTFSGMNLLGTGFSLFRYFAIDLFRYIFAPGCYLARVLYNVQILPKEEKNLPPN